MLNWHEGKKKMKAGKTKEVTRQQEKARKDFLAWAEKFSPRDGAWLKKWRAAHALSQEDLAKVLKVSRQVIIRAELRDEVPMIVVLALEGR